MSDPGVMAHRKKVQDYTSEKVTPLLNKMMEALLQEMPENPAEFMAMYLSKDPSVAASARDWDALLQGRTEGLGSASSAPVAAAAPSPATAAPTAAAASETAHELWLIEPEPEPEPYAYSHPDFGPVSAPPTSAASSAWSASKEFLADIPVATFQAIATALDPFEAQERVISECCSLLKCDRASIFLADHGAKQLVLHVAKGVDEIRIPITAGIAGHVASTGERLIISDPYSDARFNKATDIATGYFTSSILAVPVRDADGNTLGVLQAINKIAPDQQGSPVPVTRGATFETVDLKLALELAVLAGITLHNAQLYEQVRVQEVKTGALVQVVKSVAANMGVNSVIFTITQKCPQLVECTACTMYLVDTKRQQLWSVATDTGKEFRVPIEGTIAGHVAAKGCIVNIPDCYEDKAEDRPAWNGHAFDKANNFHTDNMLVMPIMMQFSREVVGVLQLINKKVTYISGERRGFTDADEDLLESFLGIAAGIIKNSVVFEQMQQSKKAEADAVFAQTEFRRKATSAAVEMEAMQEGDEEEEEEEEEEDEEEDED